MNPTLIFTMALCALAAGYIGWRRWTRKIYRRTYCEFEVPEGMTRREYDRALRRQGKRWRLAATFLYAVCGALGGVLLLLLFAGR